MLFTVKFVLLKSKATYGVLNNISSDFGVGLSLEMTARQDFELQLRAVYDT
jgi:hypothetical protein